MFSFENLLVYKKARVLVKDVYNLQREFPREEKYELGDQIRRSITSVTSNIAEGSGRFSIKEKIHFTEIAYGSLTETLCQLDIAHDLNYITDEEFANEKEKINVIGKQLSGLRASFQNQ